MADRIGLLGGTFDPVHNGHLAIARSFLASTYIDRLWVVPSPDPPHKKRRELTPFRHRIKMLEQAFAGFDHVRVSDVEARLPAPSYTVRTLEYLQDRYPGHTFYLCIGSDTLSELDSWYRPDEIIRRVELLVAERPGMEPEPAGKEILDRAHFIDHEPLDISSTDLRERLMKRKGLEKLIPPSVLHYIEQEQLYT